MGEKMKKRSKLTSIALGVILGLSGCKKNCEKVFIDENKKPFYPWIILEDINRNGKPDLAKTYFIGPPNSGYFTIRNPTEDEINWYRTH